MSVRHAYQVRETREVVITDLPDDCISHTRAGRVPIRCHTVELHYDIPTQQLAEVYVRGVLRDERDISRRAAAFRTGYPAERDRRAARDHIERSYHVDWDTRTADVPTWLAELIEEHRPDLSGMRGSRSRPSSHPDEYARGPR